MYNTYRVLGAVINNWSENSPPKLEDISTEFLDKCLNEEQLMLSIKTAYNNCLTRAKLSEQIHQSKKIVKNHLEGCSQILDDIASNMLAQKSNDKIKIYEHLNNDNIIYPIKEIDGVYSLNCKYCGGLRECKKLANNITKATGTIHVVTSRRCGNTAAPCVVSIAPAQALRVSYSVSQRAKSGAICGDAFIMKKLSGGSCLIAIADGMGSGPRANVEAKSAISLLCEFLDAGFKEDTVFSIINKALLLRSGSETFATIDACIIDPVDRCYKFLKVGSPSSFIYRENSVINIDSPSLPVGIMENAECVCIKRAAHPGDVIVLGSDGFGEKTMHRRDISFNQQPNKLSNALLKGNMSKIKDDVTIICASIKSPLYQSRRKTRLSQWKKKIANEF